MKAIDIVNEIIAHQIQGVMIHNELANMFDFMGLRGFKRMHEYHLYCEFAEMRSINRYAINHLNYLPNTNTTKPPIEIIPANWYNGTRFDVEDNERKQKVKELFAKWRKWELDTKPFYESKFKELTDMGAIAVANKVNDLICDEDNEIKCLERKYLEYSAVGWDMTYIMDKQDELHNYYENKMKEEYCVNYN